MEAGIVTIVIPTHNRHAFLQRILEYYSDTQFIILVADSSTDRYSLGEIPSNVTYLHYPGYTMIDKLGDAFSAVGTEFVLMCADDDFIIPGAIRKCTEFLRNNPSFSSAQGIFLGYYFSSGKVVFKPINVNSIGMSAEEEGPLKRMEKLLGNYMHLQYSVHRTKDMVMTFSRAAGKLSNYTLLEFSTCFISLISGKYKAFTFPYAVRDLSSASYGKSSRGLVSVAVEEKYKEEYEAFLRIISSHYAEVTGSDYQHAEEDIKAVVSVYCEWVNRGGYKQYLFMRKKSLREKYFLLRLSDKVFYRKFIPERLRIYLIGQTNFFYEFCDIMKVSPSRLLRKYPDFVDIKRLLEKYPVKMASQ